MNPERVGWHWFVRGDFYSLALWHRGHFTFQDTTAWPEEFSQLDMTYAGPCFTPAEVEARVKEARRDALEDCAKWHDEVAAEYKKEQLLCEAQDSWTVAYVFAQGYVINNKRAAAIRALKGEGPASAPAATGKHVEQLGNGARLTTLGQPTA
jgi:hypothetical protein